MALLTLLSTGIWDTIIFLAQIICFFHMHLIDFCRKTFILKFAKQKKTKRRACDGNILRDGLSVGFQSVWYWLSLLFYSQNSILLLCWTTNYMHKSQNCRAFLTTSAFLYLGNSKLKWPEWASIQRVVIRRCGFGNDSGRNPEDGDIWAAL